LAEIFETAGGCKLVLLTEHLPGYLDANRKHCSLRCREFAMRSSLAAKIRESPYLVQAGHLYSCFT